MRINRLRVAFYPYAAITLIILGMLIIVVGPENMSSPGHHPTKVLGYGFLIIGVLYFIAKLIRRFR